MDEIKLDDLFDESQTSEEVETDEEINIDDLEETTEEVEETESEETETEEEEVEEEPFNFGDIDIKWDDTETKLSSYEPDEITKYMGLGLKTEKKIAEAREFADNTVKDFKDVAELYGMEVPDLLEQLKDQAFTFKAENEQRHIDDIRKDFNSKNKPFSERNKERLLNAYPELKDIPKEVLDSAKLGKDMLTEYEKHLTKKENAELKDKITDLEKQLKVLNQNKKTKEKAFIKKKTGNTSTKDSLLNSIDQILKM